MRKHFVLVLSIFLMSFNFTQVTFAKNIPKNYQYYQRSKFEPKKTSMVEPGIVHADQSGHGESYFIVDEDGFSHLCTADGEIVTYEEVQEYFHLNSESEQEQQENYNNTSNNSSQKKSAENKSKGSSGDVTLGRLLGDISMGNHPLAPYYGSDIIVPRPAESKYPPVPKVSGNLNFSDINGHWAESYIKRFVSEGYLSGYPDGTFRPNAPVTYAEFCSIAARFNFKPVRWQGGFVFQMLFDYSSSINDTQWYYNAVMKVSEAGLFGNYSKITLDKGTEWNGQTAYYLPKLTEPAQRQHIAMFAANMLKYDKRDLEINLNYIDENKINPYSNGVTYDAVKRLVSQNVISGYPDGSFRPEGTITRAELVVMLTKILDKYNWDINKISDNLYGNYNLYNWEQTEILLNLINQERKDKGIDILKLDKDLQALTEIRVIEKSIYGYKSGGSAHSSQFYGSKLKEIANSFGYDEFRSIGENALMARGNAETSHGHWKNSEGHRENYLRSNYKYGGFAVGEDCAYEMFSQPK